MSDYASIYDAPTPDPWRDTKPTEPGKYWFYGPTYEGDGNDVHLVEVHKTSNSVVCVCEGNFLYDARGLWQPCLLPVRPDPNDPRLP